MSIQSSLFHLKEAKEELEEIITAIENKSERSFDVSMQHLYHHVNFAWNTRNVADEEIDQNNPEDFNAWRQFPRDLDMNTTV